MVEVIQKANIKWIFLMSLILMVQLAVATYFCIQKQGFHYDEYYSYYSSNKTYGLIPTDREWKDVSEIQSEFIVRPGEGFQYGLVKKMQSFDVHPPLYYMVLHTVCSLIPGIFTKWTGLSINLIFFAVCYVMMGYLSYHIFHKNKVMTTITCLLFGFQTGVLSGITFIRMYMLLTLWCLVLVLWHIPVWKRGIKLSLFSIKSLFSIGSLFFIVMAGFLTHYYFAVFLFFMATYNCLFQWLIKRNFRGSFVYGMVICIAMAVAVLIYPASLSHIFRGYRGTEATGAFFNIENTFLRIDFFVELMDQSVFGGVLVFLSLILILLFLTLWKMKKGIWENIYRCFTIDNGIFHVGFATLGYFLVVAKTALLNAEEANRYELPVYGYCMLLMVALFYYGGICLKKSLRPDLSPVREAWPSASGIVEGKATEGWETKGGETESEVIENISTSNKNVREKMLYFCGSFLILFTLGCQIKTLVDGKVQFLYQKDRENIEWAAGNKDKAVMYLYNPGNQWMIWDESLELMQYDKIYFVSMADSSPVYDERLLEEKEIYVYATRMDEANDVMEQIIEDNKKINKVEKVRELLYCDLYRLVP